MMWTCSCPALAINFFRVNTSVLHYELFGDDRDRETMSLCELIKTISQDNRINPCKGNWVLGIQVVADKTLDVT